MKKEGRGKSWKWSCEEWGEEEKWDEILKIFYIVIHMSRSMRDLLYMFIVIRC